MSHTIVQNALAALASRDPDRIAAVLTEDAEWLSPPENAVAVALGAPSHMVGRAAIVRFFSSDLPRLFPDLAVDVRGGGAVTTVEATVTATVAAGGAYRNDYCFVFEVKDGLVHRVREYADTARGHRMLGQGTP